MKANRKKESKRSSNWRRRRSSRLPISLKRKLKNYRNLLNFIKKMILIWERILIPIREIFHNSKGTFLKRTDSYSKRDLTLEWELIIKKNKKIWELQWSNHKSSLFTIQLTCLMFQWKQCQNNKYLIHSKPFKHRVDIHFLIPIFLLILFRERGRRKKLAELIELKSQSRKRKLRKKSILIILRDCNLI